MNKWRKILASVLAVMSVAVSSLHLQAEDFVFSGIVKERSGKKKLAGVSLSVPGSNIGTVSNSDGSFTIKIPDSLLNQGIYAELLGYKSSLVGKQQLRRNRNDLIISLGRPETVLDPLIVYGADPRRLLETAIAKISANYPSTKNLYTSFYRETIQKGKRYIGVSEAIVDVFKNPYKNRNLAGDKVQVIKGRKLVSPQNSDTLAVKIMGGPMLPVVLDVVKNENLFFSPKELDLYEFKLDPTAFLDDRQQFVVSFQPTASADYPLHRGKVYIDRETLSITKTEFTVDMSDSEKASKVMLHKKPRGLRFKPQELDCEITYKYQDGVSHLNYIRTKTRFKCDWKWRLFSSGYTINAELVMVDRLDNPPASISRKDAYRDTYIFSDMVEDFRDPDFWKDYNIIAPTESLDKAVLKLGKGR